MEVITTILLCAVGLLAYLVNANNSEVLRLKLSQRELERETEQFLTEKDDEISNLKKQLASEKNKILCPPVTNGHEISKLKKELEKNRGEIFDLQKKLREKENIISDLRNINSNLNLKSDNEIQNLRRQLSATQNGSNEIFALKSKLDKRETDVKTLNQILSAIKNENDELKKRISKLERELKSPKNTVIQGTLFPNFSSNQRFVQVVFLGYSSDKRFDYLLGDNPDIKVGDFVMVGTKGGARRAKVIYLSKVGEFSEHAHSPIIKKV